MSQYRYCSTAYLWRELQFLKTNREKMEDLAQEIEVPFSYHVRRKEILKVLAARAERRSRKAA
jgi:hypothetical protein